ncbi:hypothetical protein AGR5A_Cc70037 [Agrobacterium genomosp. 5 str. CFBP 6626]|nr:hypothetical protein AGR5A_Cc70037 [Agrobacterium genomosp. 5 str. CFBP 6626]
MQYVVAIALVQAASWQYRGAIDRNRSIVRVRMPVSWQRLSKQAFEKPFGRSGCDQRKVVIRVL